MEGYMYDLVGNRTMLTSTIPSLPGSIMYSYDGNDRLSTDTYDNNGNTTVSGGVTNTYDFENRMLAHGSVTMVYDGDGNRVSEKVGSVTTKYLVDTLNPTGYSQVLDEVVGTTVKKVYTYGLQRISENQVSGSTWTPTFYGYDGHGNVRFLTSSTGTVGNTYQYDAFGMPVASTGTTLNTYLYSGERFDSNLGLYHLRARYYNQATGRFETMDPYWGTIRNPATLPRYYYTANNPTNFADPSGRMFAENTLLFKTITVGVGVGFLAIALRDEFCRAIEEAESFFPGSGAQQGLPYVSGPPSIPGEIPGCSIRSLPHDESPGPPEGPPKDEPRNPEDPY
jgi:RHS repeat-associated protein